MESHRKTIHQQVKNKYRAIIWNLLKGILDEMNQKNKTKNFNEFDRLKNYTTYTHTILRKKKSCRLRNILW